MTNLEKLLSYVNQLSILIENNMLELLKDKDLSGYHYVSTVEKPVIEETTSNTAVEPTYNATAIITDKLHRFVTDEQIASYNGKINEAVMNDAINVAIANIKSTVNKRFDDIFNMSNAEDIIGTINSIVELQGSGELITLLAGKISVEEYEAHLASNIHLTVQERETLDRLKILVTNSFADWNATPEDANYIKNKPVKLPANGGNADTIDFCTKKYLMKNKRTSSVVIGIKTLHTLDDVDYLCDGVSDADIINEAISENQNKDIYFREGNYIINESLNIHDVNISGSSYAKITFSNSANLNLTNAKLSDITLSGCVLNMTGTNKIKEIESIGGRLIFNRLDYSSIKDCTFKDMLVKFNSPLYNNLFVNNIFINMRQNCLDVCGGYGNIIKDNIFA